MKSKSRRPAVRTRERGQTLVILVISLTAFLAFLALTLDGGYTWAQRRKAQNAADAGALAGTRQLCIAEGTDTEKEAVAFATAQEYAVTRNGATSADVSVSVGQAYVEVTTHVVFNTFFAHLLGRPEIDAQATARAACFTPSEGEGVLPIAWSCKKPPASGGPPSSSEDCIQQAITQQDFESRMPTWGYDPDGADPELYLILDSDDFENDLYCHEEDPSSPIICDLDGDGEIDVQGAGDRSWLDLDGGGNGANQLKNWINGVNVPDIVAHLWVPDSPGNKGSAFKEIDDHIGQIYVLPVFDAFCQGDIPNGACSTLVHPEDTWVDGQGHSDIYVHITTFAGFGVTCVKSTGNSSTCPAWEAFRAENEDNIPNINSFKTVEGFFIEGYIPGVGGGEPGPPDAGVYVLLLTK